MDLSLFQLTRWIKAYNIMMQEREEAREKDKAQEVHMRRVR